MESLSSGDAVSMAPTCMFSSDGWMETSNEQRVVEFAARKLSQQVIVLS